MAYVNETLNYPTHGPQSPGRSLGRKLKQKYANSPFVINEDYEPQDWKIVYCKAAQAWTEVPDSLCRVFKQQVRWRKSFIRNIFFTGAFYWRKPLLPVMVYYLHILFILAGPFISFRHLVYLPLNGNPLSAFLYLSGIAFIGFAFAIAYVIENREREKSD